ncbi:MAG TPA: aldo/keto reductase, partial [Acidimicrobiales bacterium]
TMHGIRRLQRDKVVTHAGVSNFDLARWEAAEAALGSAVLSNQVLFNLVHRRPEHDMLPWAQETGHVVIAYSPLAQGFLGARYDADNRPGGVRATNALFLPENLRRGQEVLAALREVAAAHGVTPAQVALAWLIRKPNVVAIPGASSVAQLEANAAAAEITLTEDENLRLTAAAEAFEPVSGPSALPRLVGARFRR